MNKVRYGQLHKVRRLGLEKYEPSGKAERQDFPADRVQR